MRARFSPSFSCALVRRCLTERKPLLDTGSDRLAARCDALPIALSDRVPWATPSPPPSANVMAALLALPSLQVRVQHTEPSHQPCRGRTAAAQARSADHRHILFIHHLAISSLIARPLTPSLHFSIRLGRFNFQSQSAILSSRTLPWSGSRATYRRETPGRKSQRPCLDALSRLGLAIPDECGRALLRPSDGLSPP